MFRRLKAYKPAASARLHLLLAAMMWTVVGALLLFFGVCWIWDGGSPYGGLLLAGATVAGLLKARFVLRRAAGRTIERIRARGDGYCLGGFLSWQSWLLVLLMIAAGRLLRGGGLPRAITGFLYAAIGIALLVAAHRIWHAWYRHNADV
jgi:hypothetical protein